MPLLLMWTGLAFADAIGPEPENCPTGSEPWSSHFSEYCRPTTCAVDNPCADGECRPVGLCIETFSETNDWWTEEPETYTWSEAYSTCSTDADCEGAARCIVEDRCAAPGCGCSAGAGSGAALGLIGLLGLVGFVRRRD